MSCSTCPTCPLTASSSVSTITLPNAGKCWNTTVNFVNGCTGLCELQDEYSPSTTGPSGASATFVGFDYQVACNAPDSYTINNNCDQQASIPSTFTSFCPSKRLTVTPFIKASNGETYKFLPVSGSSALSFSGSARLYKPPAQWYGPCILVNLNQSTNQACCQQIWNVYYQILPAGQPSLTAERESGNILLTICPNETCPLAFDSSGNTTFEIQVATVPEGGNVIQLDGSSVWNAAQSYNLDVEGNSGVPRVGCGNVTIGPTLTGVPGLINDGTNQGNIRIATGNAAVIRVIQQSDNCQTLPSEFVLANF